MVGVRLVRVGVSVGGDGDRDGVHGRQRRLDEAHAFGALLHLQNVGVRRTHPGRARRRVFRLLRKHVVLTSEDSTKTRQSSLYIQSTGASSARVRRELQAAGLVVVAEALSVERFLLVLTFRGARCQAQETKKT